MQSDAQAFFEQWSNAIEHGLKSGELETVADALIEDAAFKLSAGLDIYRALAAVIVRIWIENGDVRDEILRRLADCPAFDIERMGEAVASIAAYFAHKMISRRGGDPDGPAVIVVIGKGPGGDEPPPGTTIH